MKIKKILPYLIFLSVCFNINAEKFSYSISEEEERIMTEEADDFIDNMVEGGQDRQSDAVSHALWGHPEELKRLRDVASKNRYEKPEGITEETIQISGSTGNIDMKLYKSVKSQNSSLPLLIYFHSGGWTVGSKELSEGFCSTLASSGKLNVLNVDYGLTPENKAEKILADCISTIKYAFENAEKLGTSGNLISVGGEGAGANLALGAVLVVNHDKEDKKEKIRSLVLNYPLINTNVDKTVSWKKYGRGYGFDSRLAEALYESYGEKINNLNNLFDEVNFPPILIISAERDIVFDEGQEFADKMKEKGVEVYDVVLKGAIHGFTVDGAQKKAFDIAIRLIESFLQTK